MQIRVRVHPWKVLHKQARRVASRADQVSALAETTPTMVVKSCSNTVWSHRNFSSARSEGRWHWCLCVARAPMKGASICEATPRTLWIGPAAFSGVARHSAHRLVSHCAQHRPLCNGHRVSSKLSRRAANTKLDPAWLVAVPNRRAWNNVGPRLDLFPAPMCTRQTT